MSRFIYKEEHKEFVRKVATGRYNDEIAELFNKKFKTNKTPEAMRNFKARIGVRSGVSRYKQNPNRGLFTKEQKDFIKNNVKGLLNKELAELMNKTYGLSVTAQQINTYKSNNKLSSGLTARFKKGQKAWNKGMKGIDLAGENGKKTQFRKGQKSHNQLPVGTERINGDGYIYVKIADPKTWKAKHQVVYERFRGKIRDDHVIVFSDGDKLNLDIDNLVLVSRNKLSLLNKHGYLGRGIEVLEAGLNVIKIDQIINDRELKGKDYDKYRRLAENIGIEEKSFLARLKRGWTLQEAAYLPKYTNVKSRRVIS